MLAARWNGLDQAGVLVANPVPDEHAIDRAVVESAIATALDELRDAGVEVVSRP